MLKEILGDWGSTAPAPPLNTPMAHLLTYLLYLPWRIEPYRSGVRIQKSTIRWNFSIILFLLWQSQ